jgi:hypothetical protein
MSTRSQVVFDAASPDALSRFWAEALGYRLQDPPGGFETWEDFLTAQGVPEAEWDRASAVRGWTPRSGGSRPWVPLTSAAPCPRGTSTGCG